MKRLWAWIDARVALAGAERHDVPRALEWVRGALAALAEPEAPLARAALETNFAWTRVEPERARDHAAAIAETFRGVERVLLASATTFAAASERAARAHFPEPAPLPPAYAVFGDRVYVTSAFSEFGPMCRAAMVVHEAVHLVDPTSGDHDVHVSEWDEPRFSSLSPEHARRNPSAYASFAAQVFVERPRWPREARFGAGNPRR